MGKNQHLRVVNAAQRNAEKIVYPNADSHPHTAERSTQDDAFAVKLDAPHAAICAGIMRIEADGQREGVEPQGAARPSGVDPAYCCLTPHGFSLPAGIMFPVDSGDFGRASSVSA
jgi:hypothetical protein